MLVHSELLPGRILYTTRHVPNSAYNVSGIVVPQIHTAEEAEAIVSYAKFPPRGLRGQGSAFPGFALGIDIPTYMKTANETLITCVQIESNAGIENVDAICAVPGVGE